MLEAAATIVASYLIGTIPVPYLVGRAARGVDVREVGSGNLGASNVWQSVSKALVVPVGLAQIAQGLAAVMLAKAGGQGDGVAAAAGVALLIANDWNPWLRFQGGRGIGQTIGVLLALAPWALAAFTAVAIAGVALRAIPQFVGIALIAAPVAAAIADEPPAIIAGCAALAAIAIAKRVLANGAPDAYCLRPKVWLLRLLYDRDVRERDAWVRRGIR
jgi:acyl phosphate:glycerol-3-phosphate acyltransferase